MGGFEVIKTPDFGDSPQKKGTNKNLGNLGRIRGASRAADSDEERTRRKKPLRCGIVFAGQNVELEESAERIPLEISAFSF